MKAIFIAILISASPVFAQIDRPSTVPDISVRDQIKAARAKDKTDEQNDQSKRAWDRDGDGKRPWETPAKSSK